MNHHPRGWLIVLAVLSATGIAAGLYMNRLGVDVEPDSAVYMTSGILCAHGEGVSMPNLIGAPRPMIWFPPLVPWMVALCEWSGLNIRQTFGIFNAISWGLLIAWVGALARRSAGGNSTLGFFAAAAILTSNAICTVNGFLYSEPPFLLFLMGSLVSLEFWWQRRHFRWVIAAGLCVGAALLTRYVGLTLVVLGALSILVRPRLKFKRRFAALLLFSTLSVGPILAWHVWQKIMRSATGLERTLAWHPITGAQINEAIATLASFIFPFGFEDSIWAAWFIVGGTSMILIAAVWKWLTRPKEEKLRDKFSKTPTLVVICASFVVIYLGFLVATISFADAGTPLDWRLLSIAIPAAVIVAAYLALVGMWERCRRWSRSVVIFIIGGLIIAHGVFTFRWDVCRKEIYWMPGETSEALEALRTVPRDTIVFSNAPCEIYMAERRKTEDLPHPPPKDGWHNTEAYDFQAEMEAMRKTFANRGGWVIYWRGLDGAPAVSEQMLRAAIPVIEAKYFGDGALLHIADSTSSSGQLQDAVIGKLLKNGSHSPK